MEPVRVIAILAQLTRGASGGLLEPHQAASADLHSTLSPKTSHRTRRLQRCRRCKTLPPGLPEQSSDWSCRAFAAVRLPLWWPLLPGQVQGSGCLFLLFLLLLLLLLPLLLLRVPPLHLILPLLQSKLHFRTSTVANSVQPHVVGESTCTSASPLSRSI
ncbi:hypothetical protein M441DRAFT_417511 [Trichoderma asperellum CBS 433.97]|uniref:Uncharacterized protein n=1 Tax=Trichoderma asperellum (strain ATCC 204424 / CBS 433.97 / NBRC 101777) TaxID=1042311 RepID=A0A2T3Z8F3_TRIA4|nr:hypothetical protein M441DRAFT_417511 [Trichoderma asperellum CBS 433.97]PTB41091.1 hypothetical protein M441DRAFT_417511 [Trichoderma asperellum CBS 433.97]WVH32625.1 hypothetical protein [Trichoderma asperellum]